MNRFQLQRVQALVEKISKQKGVIIDVDMIEANHFFSTHLDEAMASVASYLDCTDDGRNMPSDLQE